MEYPINAKMVNSDLTKNIELYFIMSAQKKDSDVKNKYSDVAKISIIK